MSPVPSGLSRSEVDNVVVDQGVFAKGHQSLSNLDENPLRRAWRGDKEEKVQWSSVPKFESPYEEREWVKVCRGFMNHLIDSRH